MFGEYLLRLLVAGLDELAYLAVYLSCNILGVVAPLRIISAEEDFLVLMSVEYRTEFFGETVARYHVPCNRRRTLDIVGSACGNIVKYQFFSNTAAE